MKERHGDVVLWSDENIFTIEKAHNRLNVRHLLSSVQRNIRKTKIVTRLLFYEIINGLGRNNCHGENSFDFYIDKNVIIIAKTYQDEVLAKIEVL